MQDKIRQLLSDIQTGSYKAIARAITIVENSLDGYEELLSNLPNSNHKANIIGITGPPGAGKSTLVNSLLTQWSKEGKKIAVIAVDPSSPFNYGALLGDRIRLNNFYNNPDIYIRSLASRGALGGLNSKIIEVSEVVKCAPFDIILVETVGVGQSEVEIAGLADCSIVTLVPEAGDEVQTLKAGIMEIADIFVINKADREHADALFTSVKMMVHEKATNGSEIPVIKTIATDGTGIEELSDKIFHFLENELNNKEHKVQLLTEKCWQLVQNMRMSDIKRDKIKALITLQLTDSDFNIYSISKKLAES